jgi:peptide/nickel transport system substrate-binding protein
MVQRGFRGRTTRFLVLAAALALVATACGDDDDDTTSDATSAETGTTAAGATSASGAGTTAATGEPVAGGDLTFINYTDVRGLDPVLMSGFGTADGTHGTALYDGLMRFDDAEQKAVPQLAESLESTDFVNWTLKLRPGVMFSDGTPLDAEAVVFNWKRFQDPANAASFGAGSAALITAMTATDATTVDFTINKPSPAFGVALAGPLGYVGSPTAIEKEGQDYTSRPVGAGPFVLKEWIPDDHITMVRNPTYWNAPRPYLDSITFRGVPDVQQRANILKAEEADVLYSVEGGAQIQDFIDSGFSFTTVTLNGGQGYMFNVTKPPFDDPDLRRAVAAAIKPEDLSQAVYQGSANLGSTLFAEDSPFFSNETEPQGYDPALAQQLFDAYEAENGEPFSFTYSSFEASSSQLLGQYLQTAMSQFGVDVEIKVGQGNATVTDVFAKNYEIVNWGINLGGEVEPQLSNFFRGGSKGNLIGMADPAVDAGLDTAAASPDLAVRKTNYQPLVDYFNTQIPFILVTHPSEGVIASPKVGGIVQSAFGVLLTDGLTKSD